MAQFKKMNFSCPKTKFKSLTDSIDRHAKTVQPMTHGCQGFQCKGECIGAADEYWAQTVGSALIRLTVQGKKYGQSLFFLIF